MRIALYEPDIPQNTGTILRLCACLGIEAHIIEPSGFPVTDRAFRRAGMDYIDNVSIARHASFAAFEEWRRQERLQLVLLTTAADRSYLDHAYTADQVLLFGRESAGVPTAVHERADIRLRIPMQSGMRSLNIAVAAAMVAGEALRRQAVEAGADAMVTPCPLCHLSLDAWQLKLSKATGKDFQMPILHLSQLIGVAAGLTDAELKFKRHIVSVDPVLEKLRV